MANNTRPTSILIIDDDEDDFIITGEYLRAIPENQFIIDWCTSYKDALAKMRHRLYDMYFVDYRLGAKTGLDLLKEAIAANCEEPIVLLTGKGNHTIDTEAMKIGATDYLVKTELTSEKLERCIRYSLGRAASLKTVKANERRYRNIFERSKDAVFITDDHLRFKNINAATAALFECSADDLLQRRLTDFMDSPASKNTLLQRLQSAGDIDDQEIEIKTCIGEKKTCIFSASLETNKEEETHVQAIIHDITHLKKAERATLQAEKLAAAGRLVRTLAHEVRNPLNNIMLSIEQIQQEAITPTQTIYLDIINRNSKRINDLITELLDSSKPTEINLQKNVLQDIIDEVIAASIDRLTLKHLQLTLRMYDKPLEILADKEKLKIALLNIVINAIEAMEEYSGSLHLVVNNAGNKAVVKITDNGSGISEDALGHLFEPYFTSKRNGMGLGLAATLNIIQSHNATVEVTSALGVGTTFTINFDKA